MNAPETIVITDDQTTRFIPLDEIGESPTNPRTSFPEAEQAEMNASIKVHGVLQPVLMRPWPAHYETKGPRPKFELVCGARRFRGAKENTLPNIEAKIRNLTDNQVVEIQMIENLCREDLHPMDEAHGYEQMIDHYGHTAESLAKEIGKSKAYIYARLKLTALCHEARKAFREGKLNASTALLIARIPIDKLQAQAMKEITDPNWQGDVMSVRQAQKHLQTKYMLRLVEAPFSTKDTDLLKETGSCEACPKRTGNQPAGLFDDVKSADVCTDPDCYAKKKAAHLAKATAEARKAGQEVITGKAAKEIAPHGTQFMGSGDKLVKLDDKCYDDPKHRTYRQVLGDKAPEPKLLEDVKTGHLVEVVEKKQLAEAMKKAGVVKPKNAQNTAASKEEKAAELEKTFRAALLANVRNELVNRMRNDGAGLTLDEARLVTRKAFIRLWDDSRKRVAKLWLPDMKGTEAVNVLRDRIPTMPPEDLCLLQMDMSLVGEAECSRYTYHDQPVSLIDAAKRLGLDPAEIRKDIECEAAEKAKPATKAARAAKSKAPAKAEEKPAAEAKAHDAASEKTDRVSQLDIGDRVRVKEGLKGPGGKLRKCCGREGMVEAIDGILLLGGKLTVRFGPAKHDFVSSLSVGDVEKLPPATQAAQAVEHAAPTAAPADKFKEAEWPFPSGNQSIETNKTPAADAAKGDIEKNEKPSAKAPA